MKNKKLRFTTLIILSLLLIIGIAILFGDSEKSSKDINKVESSIESSFIEITGYDYKRNLFGKWVISGHLDNKSAYAIDTIEFELQFNDNTEFVIFDDLIEAADTNVPFQVKVTGHKTAELNAVLVREVKKSTFE